MKVSPDKNCSYIKLSSGDSIEFFFSEEAPGAPHKSAVSSMLSPNFTFIVSGLVCHTRVADILLLCVGLVQRLFIIPFLHYA